MTSKNSQSAQEQEEEWKFSVWLPFDEDPVAHLVTKHAAMPSNGRFSRTTSRASSSDSNGLPLIDEADVPETESLLFKDDSLATGRTVTDSQGQTNVSLTSSSSSYCWKYQTPRGRSFQSNTLLQLSYRPGWQGIPEYTSAHRKRQWKKYCCCRKEDELQQTLEVYGTNDICKLEHISLHIRGMGECNGLQIFLRPRYNSNNDNIDLEDRPDPPSSLAAALKHHVERLGQGMPEDPFPRYSGPKDSLVEKEQEQEFIILTFALPIETETKYDPPLLWKVQLPPCKLHDLNEGAGLQLDTITVMNGSVNLKEPATHAFIQGYQSWSFTGSVWKGQAQPKPALPSVFSRAFNLGGSLPKPPTRVVPDYHQRFMRAPSFYQSDFFTCLSTGRNERLDEHGGPALLCGWLSQHEQFGLVTMDASLSKVALHATHQAQIGPQGVETDWAYGQLIAPHNYDEEPMVHFLHSVAAFNEAKPLQNGPLLTGWCSWYHYYENISEANLRSNFSKLATMTGKVPTNVAVVDDGYMTAWGDWASFKPGKFHGMGVVSRDIEAHGMMPGIWLAPFACDKHSQIAKEHPDWIIRNDRGKPANSSNCGKFFYGLDATNPQVRQHVFKSIRRAVHEWGFRVLKIDFLYAACLEGNGKFDMSLTRAQAMHLALQTIRDAAGPDIFLIGCGCPIGSGIGYADGMRISADTGPTWYPALPLPWWDHSTLPSLRAMIRNSMSRAPYGHRWWHNDPDCLLLGETTNLTDVEVASAASIVAMTCGMMLLSDDLTKVSAGRMRIVTKIFPMTGVSAVVLDLHTTRNKGLPSVLRLWCTDKYHSEKNFRRSANYAKDVKEFKHNAEATFWGRSSSFSLDHPTPHPNERKRSCIHVAKGLGTWTVLSISNWEDKSQVVHVPKLAIGLPPQTGWGSSAEPSKSEVESPPEAGYHIFCFWASRYSWMSSEDISSTTSNSRTISQKLAAHETEIFHIRPVTPGLPQYIGSDIHFSCGHEVLSFSSNASSHQLDIQLKTSLIRTGHIFVFLPVADTSHVQIKVGGKGTKSPWSVVGSVPSYRRSGNTSTPAVCVGRILRIMVVVSGDHSPMDGAVEIKY